MLVEYYEALVRDVLGEAWVGVDSVAQENAPKLVAIAAMLGFLLALR